MVSFKEFISRNCSSENLYPSTESLRLHPPVFALMRKANEDYTIPDTNMLIEKGTAVFVCSYVFHRDPQYFPNPDVFDPDRFSKKNSEKRHPFVYLPFGEGPRVRKKIIINRIIINFHLCRFALAIGEK